MLKKIVTGNIYHMGKVENPGAQKHQSVPQNPPDTNKILEISMVLHREWPGALPTTNLYISLCLTHV